MIAPLLPGSDVDRGRELALVCSGCHALGRNDTGARIGPPLWGVLGRPQASVSGYGYSDAFQNLGGHWSFEELNRYLKSPQAYAPGTRMAFAGIERVEDRADVIAFLRTLSDEPLPFPLGGAPLQRTQDRTDTPPFGGLPEDDGRELVFGTCTRCHSIHLVRQQGLSRQRWDDTLTWMIERQGMLSPTTDQREVLLTYLAKWFGPEGEGAAPPQGVEFVDGLPDAPGRQAVAGVCAACHSLRQVTQQGLDRDRWDELLDWMVEEQGMAELSPARRDQILGYLARWYGPERLARSAAANR